MIERVLVVIYLAACIGIGFLASRKVLASREEYWVAGRRIGTMVNAMAIMAALASGGSILGVMGMTYSRGIPATPLLRERFSPSNCGDHWLNGLLSPVNGQRFYTFAAVHCKTCLFPVL